MEKKKDPKTIPPIFSYPKTDQMDNTTPTPLPPPHFCRLRISTLGMAMADGMDGTAMKNEVNLTEALSTCTGRLPPGPAHTFS